MIKNIIKNIPFLQQRLSKEKRVKGDFLIKRIIPKNEFIFGKVISFSFDKNSVQMAASFHYGWSFKIIDLQKEYFIQDEEKSKDIEDFHEQCVSEFTNQHFNRFTKIFLTLTGESTFYRTFLLPQLKQKDITSAVRFEAKKIIPFPIEEAYYDYRIVHKIEDVESKRVKISLHAATKEYIHKQLAPFLKRRLKINRILHSHDTIGQLLGLLTDFNNENNYILLNINKNIIEISFYRGKTLEFSRSNTLNSKLIGKKSNSVKLEYFAESIANEIQNSLDFYSGQLNASSNNSILLYGDFAYSDEFISILNERLDISLERFPVNKLQITFENNCASEAFPVCLPVLATSVNHSILPDLLPNQLKIERKAEAINNYLRSAAAILLITLFSSWIYANKNIHLLNKEFKTTENQIAIFKASEAFHTYKRIKQEIAYDRMYLNLTKESASYMHLNLKELSRITPKNIKLFHLDYNQNMGDANNLVIQGIVYSDNIPPEIALAEFIENLSSSHFYEDVTIVRHVKKKRKDVFEIEFLIKMKGIV